MAASPDEKHGKVAPEHPEKALAVLLRMAAHDLRTPLNAMAGWLQVLQSGSDLPAPTRDRALKGLRLAVDQQVVLADGLSQVAGIQEGQAQPEISAIDVGATLREVMAMLSEEAASRVVELKVAEPAGAVHVSSDSVLIRALLRQLVGAALRLAAKKSTLLAGVMLVTGEECTVRIELGQALISAAEMEALIDYVAGTASHQPKGASAAFGLAVALHLLAFLAGSLRAVSGGLPEEIILIANFPATRA